MIKKTVLTVAMLLVAMNLWAAGGNVTATRHNLSSGSPSTNYYRAGNEDEVCIFCHTPHGGTLSAPLWNRALPVGDFTHYTSATLSTTITNPTRVVNNESLVCMSCHDGDIAVGNIINASNRTSAAPDNDGTPIPALFLGMGIVGSAIGQAPDASLPFRNLTDDHPISFSYYNVYHDVAEDYTLQLHTIAYAEGKKVRFFPTGGGEVANGKRVECSTCHDPHVNYDAAAGGDPLLNPFLVTSNAASALCLACHIK